MTVRAALQKGYRKAAGGGDANAGSGSPDVSGDGRYVAFESEATDLVAGDSNGMLDIFVHDRQTGMTTLVSMNSQGEEGDGNSWTPSLSYDGRYVAFQSEATNLAAGAASGIQQIYVHDRQSGSTVCVSVDDNGTAGDGASHSAHLSGDGRYVVFYSSASNLVVGDTNGTIDVFVRDLQNQRTARVSVSGSGAEADGGSGNPAISADGSVIAFQSTASNLVSGDTNSVEDVFVVQNPL